METPTKTGNPELFPYQGVGARWLAERQHGFLADEMGLGKTPQGVEALTLVDQIGSAVIVCPAFLKVNWQREIAKWARRPLKHQILSYDVAARDGLPQADAYLFDEGHYLKTPTTKRTTRLLGLTGGRLLASHPLRKAAAVWALSGTPAPNHAGELWPWLRAFGATELTYEGFLRHYCHVMQTDWGPKVTGNRKDRLPELRALLKPYFLRRTTDQVLKDLPAVRWGDIPLACNVDTSDYLAGVVDIGDELPKEDESLSRTMRFIGEAKAGPLAELLAYELDQTPGEKLVVFAWHRSVLDVLTQTLARFGAVAVNGSTPLGTRQERVDKFQTDPACRVFVGQIQAAGVGLTLTASSNLVFAELSWTPGDNAQAAKRVHRIGQTKPVLIRTATCAGTIDEAVNRVLERKTRSIQQLYQEA